MLIGGLEGVIVCFWRKFGGMVLSHSWVCDSWTPLWLSRVDRNARDSAVGLGPSCSRRWKPFLVSSGGVSLSERVDVLVYLVGSFVMGRKGKYVLWMVGVVSVVGSLCHAFSKPFHILYFLLISGGLWCILSIPRLLLCAIDRNSFASGSHCGGGYWRALLIFIIFGVVVAIVMSGKLMPFLVGGFFNVFVCMDGRLPFQ